MLGVGAFILLGTACATGLYFLWRTQQNIIPDESTSQMPDQSTLFSHVISSYGQYHFDTPYKQEAEKYYSLLEIIDEGFYIEDRRYENLMFIPFLSINWVLATPVLLEQGKIEIHLEVSGCWRILHFHMRPSDLAIFVKMLNYYLGPQIIYRTEYVPVGPIPARIAEQSLTGEWSLREGIHLYVLPHTLVILNEDKVHGKISLDAVERVLSLDRFDKNIVRRGLDWLLRRPESGIIRLQSSSEMVLFAVAHHKALAEELAYLARCPWEVLDQSRKRKVNSEQESVNPE